MKNLRILSLKLFFLIITSLKITRQCICSTICVTVIIIYLNIIVKKLLCLSNLTKTRVFCFYKIMRIVVINMYKNFIFGTF